MRKYLVLLVIQFVLAFGYSTSAQTHTPELSIPDPSQKIKIAELSCGQCKFHMKGKGCKLAIRFGKETYFVEGAHIDDFGNAHSKNGFCKAIRRAEVQGKIEGNLFRITYLKFLN